VSTPDIERLLNDACRFPLGPLSIARSPSSGVGWSLLASWAGRATGVHVEVSYHEPSDALCLERRLPGPVPAGVEEALLARPWVLETARTTDGGLALRLWLRSEGLEANSLLGALAELTRVEALLGLSPQTEQQPTPVEPAPPPPVQERPPEPRPVQARVQQPSWQSLAVGEREIRPAPVEPAEASRPEAAPVSGGPPTEAESVRQEQVSADRPGAGAQAGSCRECGLPYLANHAFCINCGARLH